MKVGFIVDGQAEYRSLDLLKPQLEAATGNTFLRTVRADLQPHAPYGAMARSCRARLLELEGRGAQLIVVLVDRETRTECPGDHATSLRIAAQHYVHAHVDVVIKNCAFENWLIADLSALAAQSARFSVSAGSRSKIEPNKADNVDALKLMKSFANATYEKVADAEKILAHMDIGRAGQHSRSFRRFLRIVGHPGYGTQSAMP